MRKPEYLNKQAAAKRTGLSVRRLLELAQRGAIHKRFVKDERTKRQIAVFAIEDLDQLKSPKEHWTMSGHEIRPMSGSDAMRVANMPHPNKRGDTNDSPKVLRHWMTIEEGADFIGLPEGFLLAQVKSGKLPALDVGVRAGGRWRVSKRDLEAIVATA